MIPQVKNENELRKLAGLPLKEMGESLDNILAKHREAFESVMMGQSMLYDHDTFFDELYEYFVNSGEMPYGIAKARDGDPDQWIQEYLEQEYGDDFATDDERAMDAQKAQMPASLGGSLEDRSADMGSTQVTKQLSQYHTKEEIDNGEGINESGNELKAWYDKYNKYRSADVRNLADGMFDYYLSSGVDLDAAEKGEYEALVKKYGEDKVSGRVMKYLNEMPITNAMFMDFKKIMGSVREDTVEKAVAMLGESKEPKTFKEHLKIIQEMNPLVNRPGSRQAMARRLKKKLQALKT